MGKRKSNKIKKALDRVSDPIIQLANEMHLEDGCIDPVKVKQLKELTSAAKELSGLIRSMEEGESTDSEITVLFEGGASEWAK